MNRPSLDVVLMANALIWSRRSTCSSRAAVGAVIATPHGRVIATGYNGSPTGQPHCDTEGCELDLGGHCTRTIHAEENAILQCAVLGVSCAGTTMYTTHAPCPRCAKRIIQVGIAKIVFFMEYRGSPMSIAEMRRANIEVVQMSSDEKEILYELLRTIHS